MNQQALDSFNIYKESLFSIDNDLRFWRHFIKSSIENFQKIGDREINTAIFCVYDHQFDKIGGILKCHKKVYRTKESELEKRRIDFFIWVMNLSILKAYNALEILILQAIQIAYFPNLTNPITGKKQSNNLQNRIKDYLKLNSVKIDTKNNDHLIQFLILNSTKLKCFLELPMNVDLSSKWIDFFYLISILRNTVAHNGMVLHKDVHNEIKSKARDIFERHFEIILDSNELPILCPRDSNFCDFLNKVNSLSVSICKFVFDENDLSFLELK